MRGTVLGLVGGLMAIVIAVAVLTDIFDQFDQLERIIGEKGSCIVVANRTAAQVEFAAEAGADLQNGSFIVAPYATPFASGDAPLGTTWELGEYMASNRYTGVPQKEKCAAGVDLLIAPISTTDTATVIVTAIASENAKNYDAVANVPYFSPAIPSPSDPIVVSTVVSTINESQYVGITYEPGDERQYGGLMLTMVVLLPLLLIVSLVAFVITKMGLADFTGAVRGRRGRKR